VNINAWPEANGSADNGTFSYHNARPILGFKQDTAASNLKPERGDAKDDKYLPRRILPGVTRPALRRNNAAALTSEMAPSSSISTPSSGSAGGSS
jgi:hypothetical protein